MFWIKNLGRYRKRFDPGNEVEEDPSEDEGTEAFSTEGTEAFEEEGTDVFLGKVKSKTRADQGQDGSFEQFLQKLIRLKVEIAVDGSRVDILSQNYHANTKVETKIKIMDTRSFNIPISINDVFLGDTLCDLGVNINLMSMETFKNIKGLMIIPAEKLVGVVENFKFLADIVVMDMAECPVTLGKPFLATSIARINLEYKEIVLRSKGEYLIADMSYLTGKHEARFNMNISGKVEGATGGSWKDKEEIFEVGDHGSHFKAFTVEASLPLHSRERYFLGLATEEQGTFMRGLEWANSVTIPTGFRRYIRVL
ncbi:hypothetical protein MTR_7g025100 [Medicago truncatula]|uniref:Uncharacterized protein n=1 Tax=Medicago truncatula TaxID=3880 RepID=G7KXX9_MEDTR|nr:hypothetical protein MTR_7g025100 [Medicago truncatula]